MWWKKLEENKGKEEERGRTGERDRERERERETKRESGGASLIVTEIFHPKRVARLPLQQNFFVAREMRERSWERGREREKKR